MKGAGALVAFGIVAVLAAPVVAQGVYRCGSTYSHTPCPDGAAVPVNDARSADQRQQAVAAALREAQLAQQLERDRQAREAIAAGKGPAGLRTGPKAPPAKADPRAKSGKPKPPPKSKPKPKGKKAEPRKTRAAARPAG